MRDYALRPALPPPAVNLPQRRVIAEAVFGAIEWSAGGNVGWCACPGAAQHTTANGKRDCRVAICAPNVGAGAPHASCFHAGCGGASGPAAGALASALRDMRSQIGKAELVRHQSGGGASGRGASPSARGSRADFPSVPTDAEPMWRGGKESF